MRVRGTKEENTGRVGTDAVLIFPFFFFLAALRSLQDLSSPSRD